MDELDEHGILMNKYLKNIHHILHIAMIEPLNVSNQCAVVKNSCFCIFYYNFHIYRPFYDESKI